MAIQTGLQPLLSIRDTSGRVVLAHDLPKPGCVTRWVPSRKALIVNAVKGGLLSLEEILERYDITLAEFKEWDDRIQKSGVAGLKNKYDGLHTPPEMDHPLPLEHLCPKCGDLMVDFLKKSVYVGEMLLNLPPQQYKLLEILATYQGKVVSGSTCLAYIREKKDGPIDPKLVDVVMCKVRTEIAKYSPKEYFESVWGRGYRLLQEPCELVAA